MGADGVNARMVQEGRRALLMVIAVESGKTEKWSAPIQR
jgi:hypothetical protein